MRIHVQINQTVIYFLFISFCSVASTQWVDFVHIAISECLKIPENKVKITVKRIGGAYGAKISRSSLVACACALACHLSGLPVRFVMTIEAMTSICGKRYPCASEYEVVCDSATGKIRQLSNSVIEDNGCAKNELNDEGGLQTYALGYASDGWKFELKMIESNTPSSTWCRAPGTCESIGK